MFEQDALFVDHALMSFSALSTFNDSTLKCVMVIVLYMLSLVDSNSISLLHSP